jgi:hypothetical protein
MYCGLSAPIFPSAFRLAKVSVSVLFAVFNGTLRLCGYRSQPVQQGRFNKGSRLSAKDLARLLRLGYIERIDAHDVRRLCVAFTIVEDKEAGKRRRFILWPEQLNAEVSLAYPSTCSFSKQVEVLADVHEGTSARCYDLRVGFWQLGLAKKKCEPTTLFVSVRTITQWQ